MVDNATRPENPWRTALHAALHGRPTPIVINADRVTPGASLWTGSRRWIKRFRELGLRPGDRVVHAIEPGPGAFMALAACLWEGLTVAMVAPGADAPAEAERFDATVTLGGSAGCSIRPVGAGIPDVDAAVTPRRAVGPPTPVARLIMSTSGTGGRPTLAALSDLNILSVVRTHARALLGDAERTDLVAMSALPWHHAFGLIIDLLPLVLAGATIVRDAAGGRDPVATLAEAERWGVNWMSMVPLQAARLAATDHGERLLRTLEGGVVGGAPSSPELCRVLAHTRLRVGYGQTEASPGITLGEPGAWAPASMGRPIGCETRIDPAGRLLVRGANVCLGYWRNGALEIAESDRWLNTADLVRTGPDGLVFEGRADDAFKLANGRLIDAPRLEARLVDAGLCDEAALVPTPDGRGFDVALVGAPPGLKHAADSPDSPLVDRVRTALGPPGSRLRTARALAPDETPRTRKGALDRATLMETLARLATAGRREQENRHDNAPGPTVSFPPASVPEPAGGRSVA